MAGQIMDARSPTEVTTPVAAVATVPTAAAAVDHVQATAYDPYAGRRATAGRVIQAIWLVTGIVEMLLLLRFVLRALGANSDASFAQLVYGVTAPLVAPFMGLFGTPQANGAALEPHTLVALVVYVLLGWVLAKLAAHLLGEARSATVSHAETVTTRVR
jgi:YggT family protein